MDHTMVSGVVALHFMVFQNAQYWYPTPSTS